MPDEMRARRVIFLVVSGRAVLGTSMSARTSVVVGSSALTTETEIASTMEGDEESEDVSWGVSDGVSDGVLVAVTSAATGVVLVGAT